MDQNQQQAYSQATYEIQRLPDKQFCVVVTLPDAAPTTITSFATRKAASAWIENHRLRVREIAAKAKERGMTFRQRFNKAAS